jgi:hypothetical protein
MGGRPVVVTTSVACSCVPFQLQTSVDLVDDMKGPAKQVLPQKWCAQVCCRFSLPALLTKHFFFSAQSGKKSFQLCGNDD